VFTGTFALLFFNVDPIVPKLTTLVHSRQL
jgi:hypothetical protein